MVHASPLPESSAQVAPKHALVVPSYLDVGGGRVLARFSSGVTTPDSCELSRDRARAYPGLLAPAPRTDAFYRAFSAYTNGKDVLDVGCGSAAGLIHIDNAKKLMAVDNAEVAVWYAQNAVVGLDVRKLDAGRDVLPRADVVLCVDVLGEVAEPRDVLRRIGASLGEGGTLCLAEAHASIAQELLPPVRRALSKPQLLQLLSDSGFIIEEWLSESGFLSVVATRRTNAWTRGIEAADQLRAEGLESEALDLLMNPPKSEDQGVSAAWYLRIAEICIHRGDGDGALEALLAAQAQVPDDARVLSSLAELTLKMGAPDDAGRFAIAAAQRDPAEPKVAATLAEAVGHKLSPAEHVALWSNAARLAPADVDVAVALARTAAAHDAYHIGIKALERVRGYHITLSADFHLTLGWMYLMSARVEDALMECRLASVVDSENPATSELLAAICEVRPTPVGVS